MEIGERIRLRREELDMTQDELANALGYTSRSTIAKIENGANKLKQSMILKIAEALSTTPAYIMGWEDIIDVENVEDEMGKMNPAQLQRLIAYANYLLAKKEANNDN